MTQQLHLPDYKHVALPRWWKLPPHRRPQTFEGVYRLAKRHDCLWEICTTCDGEIVERSIHRNTVSDNGASIMQQRTWNSLSASLPSLASQVVMTTNGVATALSSPLVLGVSYTSLAVTPNLQSALLAGDTVVVGYGTGQTQTFTVAGGGASAGAASIPVNSLAANANYAAGQNVVKNTSVLDNPSSLTNAYYSGALAPSAFTYSNTGGASGLGNRQVAIVFAFPASSGLAGAYTEAWTINANPVVANSTLSHLIFPALTINSGTGQTLTVVEKA